MAKISAPLVKEFFGSIFTRLFLGASSIMVTVANAPIVENWVFEPKKIPIIIAPIAAWVAAEWSSWKPTPHPHDLQF